MSAEEQRERIEGRARALISDCTSFGWTPEDMGRWSSLVTAGRGWGVTLPKTVWDDSGKTRILTGISGLDDILEGSTQGRLVVVAGKAGESKGLVMGRIAAEMAKLHDVVYVDSHEGEGPDYLRQQKSQVRILSMTEVNPKVLHLNHSGSVWFFDGIEFMRSSAAALDFVLELQELAENNNVAVWASTNMNPEAPVNDRKKLRMAVQYGEEFRFGIERLEPPSFTGLRLTFLRSQMAKRKAKS